MAVMTGLGCPPFIILTVTWSKDKSHFALLRESLRRSRFADIPHHVVVQHEDMPLFREFSDIILHSTADVLPQQVEARRVHARAAQIRWGRRGTNLAGSLTRSLSWPSWTRYTGWHTQQLSKLSFAARCSCDVVVIMDSDLIVTSHANIADFIHPHKIVCYKKMKDAAGLRGKVLHWQQSAHALFGKTYTSSKFDGYYDTPFVMHAPALRDLQSWLERRYGKVWWQVLVDLPPRRWSEFGIYKQYLREMNLQVDWRDTSQIGYLFDASDPQNLLKDFLRLRDTEKCHYITIHSQNSGRQLWNEHDYLKALEDLL